MENKGEVISTVKENSGIESYWERYKAFNEQLRELHKEGIFNKSPEEIIKEAKARADIRTK